VVSGRLELAPERFESVLARWVDEHDGASVTRHPADDLRPDPPGSPGTIGLRWSGGDVSCVGFPYDPLGLILVRRGGYAVGLAHAGRLTDVKVGRRRVQGRTAAGGWSQQRYARRRENQADELVEAVAEHAGRILGGHPGGIPQRGAVRGLVVGGDRSLVTAVLAEPPATFLADLPRRELPDLPDPDARVLARALWRGRAVWCTGAVEQLSAR
jgi:hypothetical protein